MSSYFTAKTIHEILHAYKQKICLIRTYKMTSNGEFLGNIKCLA
ncbi:hypothetical protein APHNP_0503 [Anaplasma phagocytophilum str. ApNP]|uniref:Uncharacterized protein n=1 Tax=Anaplasma phagocytophilum str. ApNP TaxID=1359153 RepID=A0A0F3NJ01_ANAPH|nr:hypothetical protein APHNP_0503 [Anaplasma phagocytophilum str. ApNP]